MGCEGTGLRSFEIVEKGGDVECRLLPGTGDVEDSDGVGLLEYAAEAAPGRAKPVDTIAPADGAALAIERNGLTGDADGEEEGEALGVEFTDDVGDGDGARDEARDEFAEEALLLCRS